MTSLPRQNGSKEHSRGTSLSGILISMGIHTHSLDIAEKSNPSKKPFLIKKGQGEVPFFPLNNHF